MMVEVLRDYSLLLIDDVPHEVYIMALILFCTGSILSFGLKEWQKGFRFSMALLLLEYVLLLYGSTVFFRETMVGRQYDFTPFWSYSEERLIPENIMNVVVFVPIGFLTGTQIKAKQKSQIMQKDLSSENHQTCLLGRVARFFSERKWGWLAVILVGAAISFGIETLQFIFKKGFAEFDDIFHNTLGCVIGYGLYVIIKTGYERISKRSLAIL